MGLKERALEAWAGVKEFHEAEWEEVARKAEGRAIKHFQERIGGEVEMAMALTDVRVRLDSDGLELLCMLDSKGFRLAGKCSQCDEVCWSQLFVDLAGLGRVLEDFQPGPHICGAPEVAEETPAEALRKALHRFLEEG